MLCRWSIWFGLERERVQQRMLIADSTRVSPHSTLLFVRNLLVHLMFSLVAKCQWGCSARLGVVKLSRQHVPGESREGE